MLGTQYTGTKAQPREHADIEQNAARQNDLKDIPRYSLGNAEKIIESIRRHQCRVQSLSRYLATCMGLGSDAAERIGAAALLHDVGKLFIPADIVAKPGPLTLNERKLMEKHTVWGYVALNRSQQPGAAQAALVALQHHECWDGSGYPLGIRGEAISLEARIISVCDVYDALRSERPYRTAVTHDAACSLILAGDERLPAGKFDPSILTTFEHWHEGFAAIMNIVADGDPFGCEANSRTAYR